MRSFVFLKSLLPQLVNRCEVVCKYVAPRSASEGSSLGSG